MEAIIVEWDYQIEIRPLIDSIIELKKQHERIITGNPNYDSYAGISGYLQALVTILGAKPPYKVVQWLKEEKEKLETELPFLALKHSGNK